MNQGSEPESKTKYRFEEDDEDFWYDPLDLRFVIPGLIMMAFSLPISFLLPKGWPRVMMLGCFLVSFVIVTKRKGRWW